MGLNHGNTFSPSPPRFFEEDSNQNENFNQQIEKVADNSDISEQEQQDIEEYDENIDLRPKKKRRRWEQPLDNDNRNKVVKRLIKVSAKGHKCTQCDHFRLPKYFRDISTLVCISCLDICFTCSHSVEPPPSKKARHPRCSNCSEIRRTRKKKSQRLSMQALRLEKMKK